MIPEVSWDRAVEVLRTSDEVIVACHVAPDGDALGAMLGLGTHLEGTGKKVWMSWGSGVVTVPSNYQFLPGVDRVLPPDRIPDAVDAFVAIDCGDVSRLELLGPRFTASGTRLNIDHHLSNTGFGDINLVDPRRASSSELVYELILRMGGEASPEIATCLYTGVVTDTGRFQFSNTLPETLRVAARLREAGADHLAVAEQVYESAPFDQLHVLGTVLSRARLENGMVYSWLELKDLGGLGMEVAEDFIDVLRAVREADIAMILKQQPEGGWKGSLRSRNDTDVSAVAQSFGGGGHAKAAGFSFDGTLEELIAAVRRRLPAASSGR